jgi:phosphatidylcholine synthase
MVSAVSRVKAGIGWAAMSDARPTVGTNAPTIGFAGRAAAWSVHLLTASGAVWALLTVLAVRDASWKAALGWMALAVLIDAMDGPLARRLRVATALPHVDGALLDNLIDYLNYAVVPAYFIYELHLLPAGLDIAAAAIICIASAFQFSHVEAKAGDQFFRGFPSYWNLVAFYFLFLRPQAWIALLVVLALSALTFVPIHYVYPTHTRRYRGLTLWLTAAYTLTILVAIIRYPTTSRWLIYGSLLYGLYYAGLSFKLTAELGREMSVGGQ